MREEESSRAGHALPLRTCSHEPAGAGPSKKPLQSFVLPDGFRLGTFQCSFLELFYALLISQSKQLLVVLTILFLRWFFRPFVTSFMLPI